MAFIYDLRATMSDQLLATKLHIPHAHTDLVSRPRLIKRLNAGCVAGHRLTLISAPAGFGKTTLLTEWQGSREQLDQQLAKFSWLVPAAVEIFGGKYDPAKLHLADKLIASLPASPLHGMPASDVRDWNAIRKWTSNLVVKLEPALAQ